MRRVENKNLVISRAILAWNCSIKVFRTDDGITSRAVPHSGMVAVESSPMIVVSRTMIAIPPICFLFIFPTIAETCWILQLGRTNLGLRPALPMDQNSAGFHLRKREMDTCFLHRRQHRILANDAL